MMLGREPPTLITSISLGRRRRAYDILAPNRVIARSLPPCGRARSYEVSLMIRRLALIRRPALFAFAAVSVVSCGGSSNPPTTTPPTNNAPLPAPTPTPAQQGCSAGLGSARYTCQGDLAGLQPRLEAAIDKLVKDQPQLFNLTDDPGGDHRYRIL